MGIIARGGRGERDFLSVHARQAVAPSAQECAGLAPGGADAIVQTDRLPFASIISPVGRQKNILLCSHFYYAHHRYELDPDDRDWENYSIDVSQIVCEAWVIPQSILDITGAVGGAAAAAAGRGKKKRKSERADPGPLLLNIYCNGLFNPKHFFNIRDS